MGSSSVKARPWLKVKRSDWGLSWNKTLETGGMLVSDDIQFDVDLEYVPAAAAAAAKSEAKAETKK